MKRLNKTLRKRRQRKQRTRRQSHRRISRRHRIKGGGLPVPTGSLVAISSKGEYGVPMLVSKDFAEKEGDSLVD